MHPIHLISLGRIRYSHALGIQQRAIDLRKQNRIGDVLLLLEHPPVITLGRNARRENVLASDDFLIQNGVELHETNRGGDVTFHGPGQLIGWPILDLRGDFPQKRGPYLGPVDYVRLLEEVLIRTCADYGVPTQRIPPHTGVWTSSTPERKLAAIGVHVSVGITSHGFAFNLTTDMNGFNLIIPCGITHLGVTSLQTEIASQPGPQHVMPTMQQVEHTIARQFGHIFARHVLWGSSLDELLLSDAVYNQ